MPDHEITINDEERELLERVRERQGLASIEQAAEWLVKSRLRKQSKNMTGRGRALYQVERKLK
ncbi:hypothetical protein D9M09_06420 [Janthinobacterium agaricidamnosum]|jgi:hypothetical protein|uniref:Uncharacterized protein n=1 Tax=Janthinobacterium agaricidamnosum TaxID=55508 RepID=A0A3G2E6D8_9BURK|nr:hypothetical protein [Janthinobacterium agaricidamnosum]AYM75472.1 hypothetical protein D9M09_06420 [Janthinobacterium agaricidamnosum]